MLFTIWVFSFQHGIHITCNNQTVSSYGAQLSIFIMLHIIHISAFNYQIVYIQLLMNKQRFVLFLFQQ